MEREVSIFHCKPYVAPEDVQYTQVKDKDGNLTGEQHPIGAVTTHTLAFSTFKGEYEVNEDVVATPENTLILGWSTPNHGENFSKKLGREYSTEKVEQTARRMEKLEEFANRKIYEVEDLNGFLPPVVIANDVDEDGDEVESDFYHFLYIALRKHLTEIDELTNVVIMFRSYINDKKQCVIVLDGDVLREAMAEEEAERLSDAMIDAEDSDADDIFAISLSANDELWVTIQERAAYYATGLDETITSHLIDVTTDLFADNDGFMVVEEQGVTFKSSTLSDFEVIRLFASAGFSYDPNLHTQMNDSDEV